MVRRLTNNVVTLEEKLDKASRIVAYTSRFDVVVHKVSDKLVILG